MERALPRAGPDGPRRVRVDRRQAPGGVRMTSRARRRRAASSTSCTSRAVPARATLHRLDRAREPARRAPGRTRRAAAAGDHRGRDRLDARPNLAGHARARTPAQTPGRRLAPMPDLPRRTRAPHDERVPRDRHGRCSRRSPGTTASATEPPQPREHALALARAWSDRAAPRRARPVAPGTARRHADRPIEAAP